MSSLFSRVDDALPKELTSREDIIVWLVENGIYINNDEHLPLNDLCNFMDESVQRHGEKMAGNAGHGGWYEMAARNRLKGLMTQAQSILGGSKLRDKET